MPLSRQEIFDTVAKHLLRQNAKSKLDPNSPSCLYRGPNGLMCAMGVLISDDVYDPNMEGKSIHGVMGNYPEISESLDRFANGDFLGELQRIHDFTRVDQWRYELSCFAYRYELSKEVLNQL